MSTVSALPSIEPDDFARRFSLRAKNLMWLLGAGASASSGVPTAGDMTWEFKQQLFASQRRIPLNSVSDLSSPITRGRIQAHIDSLGQLPSIGSEDEYAALFEEVFPVEGDRRTYLDSKLAGSRPSFGHLALATLMCTGHTRLVWTTNFDALIADACAKIFETTSALTMADLNAPELAKQIIQDERWPIEVKLHGDFRSRRLKNTSDELREQGSQLRHTLIETCLRFGLVVGYSGRDDSIMDTLDEAVQSPGEFPHGLFWLHRGEGDPSSRVAKLLAKANQLNIEVGLVPIESFDELLKDLIRLIKGLDVSKLDSIVRARRVWSGAPIPRGRRGWPVVRLNALPVLDVPTICRRVACEIGGTAEVREAVKNAEVDVIAVRSKWGVLAFGSDSDIRLAFEPYNITEFDIHALDPKRLKYDSTERGLLRQALTVAIARNRELMAIRRRRADLLAPSNPNAQDWVPLKKLVGPIHGVVRDQPDLKWREGIGVRLDWANDSIWILFEPRTVFEGINIRNKSVAASFALHRSSRRYNSQLNDLLKFWSNRLTQGKNSMRSLMIGDGIDAAFRISPITGFSRRVGA